MAKLIKKTIQNHVKISNKHVSFPHTSINHVYPLVVHLNVNLAFSFFNPNNFKTFVTQNP